MTVEKLYFSSDQLTGSAIVTDVVGNGDNWIIRLDRTLFHPRGGGQLADAGIISPIGPVLDVRHSSGGIDHFVETADPSMVGTTVEMQVDAATRRLHARLHSAGHLIAHLGQMIAPTLHATAGHHWPNEARVEFEGEVPDVAAFETGLKSAIEAAIQANLPIATGRDSEDRRCIRIADGESVPCGGTHVQEASQIEAVEIRRVQVKRGVVRVSYSVA